MQTLALAITFMQVALGYETGPDATCRLAIKDLEQNVPEHVRPFTRYLSFSHRISDANLLKEIRHSRFWVNTLSTQKLITLPQEVAGSGGKLYRILDIQDYGWNTPAWRAVAAREPYHREPWIDHQVAKTVRDLIGERPDPVTDHVFTVVRGDWFFRETAEADRSTSYYDLLYAKFRFTEIGKVIERVKQEGGTRKIQKEVVVPWKGGVWPNDGKYYEKGSFTHKQTVEVEEKVIVAEDVIDNGSTIFKFVDFPANKKDWDKAWTLDTGLFVKDLKFKTANGAVAIGMGDDPKRGSGVARNNRLLLFIGHPNVLGGSSLESFDVLDPTGDKDYVQNAPNLARGKIQFDAQELLLSLPNGAQAALLTAGADEKRVEFADPKVAIDGDPLDRRVRTPGSCVVCHAASYGVIPPINMVKEFFGPNGKTDIFFNIKNRDLERDFRGFFQNWEDKIEPVLQTPYKSMIAVSTVYGKEKPMTGPEIAKLTDELRRKYDAPLNLAQVALETGMTELKVKTTAAESPRAWMAVLVRGETVPRRVWEKTEFAELMKIWAANGELKPVKGVKK